MTSINRLSSDDALSQGDLVPIYSNGQGVTRKATAAAFVAAIGDSYVTQAQAQANAATATVAAFQSMVYPGVYAIFPTTRPNGTAMQDGDRAVILLGGVPTEYVRTGGTWIVPNVGAANLAASSGSSLVGFIQTGTGATARTQQDKDRDTISVMDFGVLGDGSDETTKFFNAANSAAARSLTLDLRGLTIKIFGSVAFSTAGTVVSWMNGSFTFGSGAVTNAPFTATGVREVDIRGISFEGNRANVTGNNAGFFVVNNAASVKFEDITLSNVRRYGINIGSSVGCTNVDISRIKVTDIGVQSGGSSVSLGEGVLVQNSTNVRINGFHCTNPSGTGDGQVLKAYFCTNVQVSDINISAASPSKVYPAMSFVRNDNIEFNEVTITGGCQVAIENNSNVNQTFRNIKTITTDKALIAGPDGAGAGDRYSENMLIDNWVDTSTAAQAFNITAVKGAVMRNISTPQDINISRDNPTNDRRSEDFELYRVMCNNLNTQLMLGRRTLIDVNVALQWLNTSQGTCRAYDTTFGSYTNSAQAGVFVVRNEVGTDVFQISGSLSASGGTYAWSAPATINNAPFSGEVLASGYFISSSATQWSKFNFDFYDRGTPTILKTVVQSGTTPRTNIALAVAFATRTLTFTNTEAVVMQVDARVVFLNNLVQTL